MATELDILSSTYQQYEAGIHEASYETLIRIADYFQVSVDFLIGRTNIRGPIPTLDEGISYNLAHLKNEKVKQALCTVLKEVYQSEN